MQDDEIDRLKAQLKEDKEKGRELMDMCRDLKVRVAELERDNAHQRERRNAARDCIQKMKAESFHKQAEAVEDIRKDLLSDLPDHRVSRQVDIRLGLRVNSLREKAEKAGGEK
ncbi:hypothetical protein [Cycloclasticus pugetii]|uniref:hypothetical protein n=1 Tax=Cycloclasticus pugetii TaxID=34068 RepID=UPI003A8EF401